MKQPIPPIRLENDLYKEYHALRKRYIKEKPPPADLSMSGWGALLIKKGLETINKELNKLKKEGGNNER